MLYQLLFLAAYSHPSLQASFIHHVTHESTCHSFISSGAFIKNCIFITNLNDKQEVPASVITEEEAIEISEADSSSMRRKVFLYEAMVDKYEHPFFLLRLANMLFILKSPTLGMQLCIKVCLPSSQLFHSYRCNR
jgi:hypothetical protein